MSRKAYLPAFGVLLMLLSLWSSPLRGSVSREASIKNAVNESARHFVESRRSLNSVYDPQVEHGAAGSGSGESAAGGPAGREEHERPSQFLELGINNNGVRLWKVYGPDLDGRYGSLQGTGGLEATVDEPSGLANVQINNFFGDGLGANTTGNVYAWGATLGGYGPMLGTVNIFGITPQTSGTATGVGQFDIIPQWRGHYIDQTGFYYHGSRYYESQSGRFISPDPLGHAASMSLYDYANGDPVNGLDPDGRFGKTASASDSTSIASPSFEVYNGPDYSQEPRVADQVASDNAVASLFKAVVPVLPQLAELFTGNDFVTQQPTSRAQAGYDALISSAALVPFVGLEENAAVTLGERALTDGAGNSLARNVSRYGAETAAIPSGLCFLPGTLVDESQGKRPIESIQLGERVSTNEKGSQESSTEVESAKWRLIRLHAPNPDGSTDEMRINLLRSLDWLDQRNCVTGGQVRLKMPELGFDGWASVESIEPCPRIHSGSGRVVTGTVTHMNGFVLRMHFDGTSETLCPTATHRFYSETLHAWIPARDLRPGEFLKTETGTIRLAAVEHLPGIHRVYNIEVEADHRYFVGNTEVLSHNSCAAGTGASAPAFNTWNEFQAGTAGQYASRAEAGEAWAAYKDANGIVTGSVRDPAQKAAFLQQHLESGKAPSWMTPWLERGQTPPGYEVDHIKPLSIGGADDPANMRLLLKADHDLWHSIYHPWR